MAKLGDVSVLNINGNEMAIKDAAVREIVNEIIEAIGANNTNISERINDLHNRSFDYTLDITSNDDSEISAINDGLYKLHYVTVTGEGEQQTETLNNSAILIQQGTHQYLYKDGKLSNREKTNDTWGDWITFEGGVTSVNGQTGAVTLSIPTKTSDITNDSGFITDAGVTSFNGQTGAVTYTAPVTSVDGKTGAVTIEHPITSVNGQTGAVTIDTGVTSFNGSTGAVTYTAPVTSVNGQTGAVTIDLTGKADKSAAIGSLQLSINSTDYKVTLSGTKVDGTAFTCEDVIDLPLETMVVSGAYDDTTQKIVLTLKNGTTTDFPVSALIDGLQSEITSTNKLSADLISDGNTNKVVTQAEKDTWNNKVTSVNGQTGAVTIDTGVISFNGQTGAVTYTAPVTSVNGQTGAVTIDTGVTSFNGQTGAVTYTAPVTSVNGQTGAVVTELSSEYATSTAVNDELELAAGDTYEEAFGKIEKALNDHATITATALNTLAQNSQLNTIESISVNGVPVPIDSSKNVDITISNDNDKVIAEALIDLNDRLEVVEGNPVGDENIIESVKVNGTALVPDANKAVDISVPVDLADLADDATHRLVTDIEKSTWNNKVTSVNGQTGAVTIDTGVTSFNGQTGAVTYTAPVTSVNGQTGAVTIDTGVTSFNGQTGAVTYTAPVTSVNGQTGAVTIDTGVTSFNGQTGAVTYTAPVTSVNGQTGAVNLSIPTKTSDLTNDSNFATTSYVSTAISNLVDSAPATLDTLNELAAALGDDPNFATTITNQIAEKYTKLSTGIPKTDLASDVQTSLGKADTALQSYTETDPTVPAHVKSITQANITNWNSKTDNVGTITGIKMNGSTVGTAGIVDLGTVITSHQDISNKVDKIDGKGLSTNDYTTAEKEKLASIEIGDLSDLTTAELNSIFSGT